MSLLIQKFRRSLQAKKYKESAFTLLEMLVTLVIVAVLMAIIIPNVSGQKDRIDKQAAENISEIVQTQADAYFMVEKDQSSVSLETLVAEGYLTQKQADEANQRLDAGALSQLLAP